MGSVTSLLPPAVLLYCITKAVYLLFFHPLSKYPGPKLAALTDLWKVKASWQGKYTSRLKAQHAKHGEVVRIGPNEVSIISPEDVQLVYGHRSEFTKGPFYDAWALGGRPNHFSERNSSAHSARRRAIADVYSINYLITLETYVNRNIELLLTRLDEHSEDSKTTNLAKYIEWYAYDSVGELSVGETYGLLENDRDVKKILEVFAEGTAIVSTAACFSSWGWTLVTPIMSKLATWAQGDRGVHYFVKVSENFAAKRMEMRESEKDRYQEEKDMLYRFIEAKDPVSGQPLDFKRVGMECLTLVVAGADTTKASLVAALRYIYETPRVLAKLRNEISTAVASGNFDFPPSYAQAARLDYLQACIKEAMRLHPAVGMPLQRVVPQGGRVIGGRRFEEGTLVGMSAWEIHRDARAYGADAGVFRPERWIEEDRGELERFNLNFGGGSRVCLGKNVSLMSMSKVIPTLLHRYDCTFDRPSNPYDANESWFVLQTHFPVHLTRHAEE